MPVAVEAAPAKAVPVRLARTKAASVEAAAVAPKNAKRNAANRDAKPIAAKAAPKPRRSRAPKAGDAAATLPDTAPVEAPAAG